MTFRKLLSIVAAMAGVFALCGTAVAVAKPKVGVLAPGDPSTKDWRDGPFTAKDTRTLIWRVSRAGNQKQKMNLDKAVISGAGIQIKGRPCDGGDTWLNFVEKSRTHMVGGKLCGGKKSFERHPGYKPKRYGTLMAYISDQMFAHTGIKHKHVGFPRLIRSNGRHAVFIFASPSGELSFKAIRAIILNGDKITIRRF
jgi:hypothetical protein